MQTGLLEINQNNVSSAVKDWELKSTLLAVEGFLTLANSNAKVVTDAAFRRLMESTDQKKLQVLTHLRNLIKIFELQGQSQPETISDHPEESIIRQALKFYGLEVGMDFWKILKKEDIIEIYNEDNIQVFRTFNLFNTCGYSLTELLTNEWYVLWERPSFVLQALLKYSEQVLAGSYASSTKMHIASHIVKEVYNEVEAHEFKARTALVEFGHLAPLLKNDHNIGGFIITSRGVVGEVNAEDVNKVRMI